MIGLAEFEEVHHSASSLQLNNLSKSLIEPPDNFLAQISQIQFISIQRSIIDSGPLKVFSFFNRIIKSLQRLSASKSFKFIDLD